MSFNTGLVRNLGHINIFLELQALLFQKNLGNTAHQSIRKQKIIWFNPPFNSAVSTNIGKEFFKLLNKHFPKHHKICNWNNVKLSYSCMQNMQAIINRHNKTLLAKNGNINTTSSKTCNCRVKADCPLQGNC